MNPAEKGWGGIQLKRRKESKPHNRNNILHKDLNLILYFQEFVCNAVTTDQNTPTQSSNANQNFVVYKQNLMRNHSSHE